MTHYSPFANGRVWSRRALPITVLSAALFAAACSGSDATSVTPVAGSGIGFTTRAPSANSALAANVPITNNGDTLDLTGVTVVVERAWLKRDRTDECEDSDNRWRSFFGCRLVRVGPTIVDLPLDDSVVTLPANAVPAGTFKEIAIRISMVRLTGTFDSKAFDVTVPVNAKAEVEFDTPLEVLEDSAVAVTVHLPVDTWLVNSDGSLVDPTKLLGSPSQMAAVRRKIASTIRAFEDHDHDGREDHKRGHR